MSTGSATLELDVTLSFHRDGALQGLHSICLVGDRDERIELPADVSRALYAWLSDRQPFDRLRDDCWYEAEDDGPNHEAAAE